MNRNHRKHGTVYYHFPGLFEFYELYKKFLKLFYVHREYFYDWCEIGSIYGVPIDCIWGGGRVSNCDYDTEAVIELMEEYKIPARLTFSNSQLQEKHLSDRKCNALCARFERHEKPCNGIIVHSEFLLKYLKETYPDYEYISSTTKVITDFSEFVEEINREEFQYVVPDFRLNKRFEQLQTLSQIQKDKVEFHCITAESEGGYRFSKAMKNPGFISVEEIQTRYVPMGFSNFKIEGRGLGSAVVLEFLLYYMTKPEYQLIVREEIYLDSMLDLF